MTQPEESGIRLQDALAAYPWDGGEVAGALRHGKGHINDTFAVYTQQPDGASRRYILQRINTHVFKDPAGLMENICGVTEYLGRLIEAQGGDPARERLTVRDTREGSPMYTDPDGGCWRVYDFIEKAVCYQVAETPQLFKASARAFGTFARQLEGYPAASLHETIARFHDTPRRFRDLQAAVEADVAGRRESCRPEIEFALAREADAPVLMDALAAGRLPLRVTHNDTKLNNIMMDPVTREGVCVIDLDTIMPGLILNDYGDSIRFGANSSTEDEKDLGIVQFSLPLYQTYTEGFLEAAGPAMTEAEKELLPWGARLMTYECGLRFLTDYLEGDIYFKTARPAHNLDRCRSQFKLVADMEAVWSQMDEIARRCAAQ